MPRLTLTKENLAETLIERVMDIEDMLFASSEIGSLLHMARRLFLEHEQLIEKREAALNNLFDGQISTLVDRGCPEGIITMLSEQKKHVVKEALNMQFEWGTFPFLPVIPLSFMTMHSQMHLTTSFDGKVRGGVGFDPSLVTDTVKTPSRPYFLLGVSANALVAKKASDANRILSQRKRLPVTTQENIAIWVHAHASQKWSQFCKHYWTYASASRYDTKKNYIPCITNSGSSGRPYLMYHIDRKCAGTSYGTPYCTKRKAFL